MLPKWARAMKQIKLKRGETYVSTIEYLFNTVFNGELKSYVLSLIINMLKLLLCWRALFLPKKLCNCNLIVKGDSQAVLERLSSKGNDFIHAAVFFHLFGISHVRHRGNNKTDLLSMPWD